MPYRKSRAAAAAAASTVTVAAQSKVSVGSSARHRPSSSNSDASVRAGIHIHIANHYAAKIYTSGASIVGETVIRVRRDTCFERVAVQFAGLAATRNYMTPEIDQVLHNFLLLDMPLDRTPQLLPADGILRAGRAYTLPFHFVIPLNLPISSCRLPSDHVSVREHHLRLPPTVGGNWGDRKDDSPDTARIHYYVTVSVLEKHASSSEPMSGLRCSREVNVLPGYTEDAPLDVQPSDKYGDYKLSSSKPLRKSLLSRKLGTVSVEALQPAAVTLASDTRGVSSSHAPLHLQFFPASSSSSNDAQSPPSIHAITAKLVTKTHFNTLHMSTFPDGGLARHDLNYGNPLFYASTGSSFDVQFDSSVAGWQLQNQPGTSRTWSNNITLHFKLPIDHNKKMLLPTFHSCLVSRTYTLRVNVLLGPGRTCVALSLPLQVAVDIGDASSLSITGDSTDGMHPGTPFDESLEHQHQQLPDPGIAAVKPPTYRNHYFPNRHQDEDDFHHSHGFLSLNNL